MIYFKIAIVKNTISGSKDEVEGNVNSVSNGPKFASKRYKSLD